MTKNYSYLDSIENPKFRFNITVSTLDISSFPIHTHDFAELVIILGGTGLHTTSFGAHPLIAGDVFVIRDGVAHGFQACRGLKLCNIMYDPDEFLQFRGDITELAGYYALFVIEPLYWKTQAFHSRLHLNMTSLQAVAAVVQAIQEEFVRRQPAYQSMIQGYFTQLVVYLARQYTEISADTSNSLLQLAQVVMLMENAYHQDLTLDDLAAAANLSKTHLLRVFKAAFQLSPIQYLIRLRISHACRLLKQTPCSISEVAFQVGFNDSNYFSRQFKQIIGMSPLVYQRNRSDI